MLTIITALKVKSVRFVAVSEITYSNCNPPSPFCSSPRKFVQFSKSDFNMYLDTNDIYNKCVRMWRHSSQLSQLLLGLFGDSNHFITNPK
jgi:hypothetical protein